MKTAAMLGAALAISACGDAEFAPEGAAAWALSSEPLLTIGELDGPDDYLFQRITGGRFLPDGGLVVSDGGLLEIRVFGPDGGLAAKMGREGEGPGEFASLDGVWVTPDGAIGAMDPRLYRLQVFSVDGTHLRSHAVARPGAAPGNAPPVSLDVLIGTFEDGSIALGSLGLGGSPSERTLQPDRFLLTHHERDGAFLGSFGDEPHFQRFDRGPVAFSPVPYAAVHGDSVYFADSLNPRIEVRDTDGNVGRTIPLPVEPVDEDAAYAALAGALEGNEGFYTVERLEAAPRPNGFPVVAGLAVDDRGFVWVRRFTAPDDALWLSGGIHRFGGEWWVFDPAGDLAATVEMPTGLRPLDIREDRLLGLSRDEFDVERIVVYAIER